MNQTRLDMLDAMEVVWNATNITENFSNRTFSPVTLNHAWPRVNRLVIMVTLATIGTISNGYYISSFFIEHCLKKLGYVFMVCLGIADMIMTGFVMVISSTVLLSGQWDNQIVCDIMYFAAVCSTYLYLFFFMMVGLESYIRICHSKSAYETFLGLRIGCVTLILSTVAGVIAANGVFLGLDYDYCSRKVHGDYFFRAITSIVFHVIPGFVALLCLAASVTGCRSRAKTESSYRRSRQYTRDLAMTKLNLIAFLLFLCAWIPYIYNVHKAPAASDATYYYSAWLGVLRSVLTSVIYGLAHSGFRRAYKHLFKYCCLRTSLTGPFTSRHRRFDGVHLTNEVRVHMLHQIVARGSSPRPAAAVATHEL